MRDSLRSLFLLALTLWFPLSAHAADLLEVYRLALGGDPRLQAAIAGNRALQEAPVQARAQLLPNVNLSADTSDNDQESSRSSDGEFNSHGYTLSVTQPLFRLGRWYRFQQSGSLVQQADAELTSVIQELAVRAATAYFNMLTARDTLEFAQQTKTAIAQQLRQAQQRFDVGLIAITDVEEAKAGFDLAASDEIAAKNQVANAREALRALTGTYLEQLAILDTDMPLAPPEPSDVTHWTNLALQHNPLLSSKRYAASVARDDIRIQRSGHYPTLDLVGGRVYSSSGGGTLGGRKTMTDSIGVELNIPIYSGNSVVSGTREARHLYQQAMDELERANRATQRATRDAYLGVLSGISRVKALQQSLTSTRTALKATEAGFEAGTRTTVDVLDALRETFRASRDYKVALYEYLLDTLKLKQSAGVLRESDLAAINTWFH